MSRIANDLASSSHSTFVQIKQAEQDQHKAMHGLRVGKVPKVAIIGAGVSGLRCANLLAETGSQVTIFEARDRIGGRVNQVENGGYLVDTGSNWIHGTEGNPIMTLAEITKTILMEPSEDTRVIDKRGQKRSVTESQMLSAEFWDMILQGFKYSDENSAHVNPSTGLAEWVQKEWSKKFQDSAKVDDLVCESKLWGQFVGSPIETQSLKFFFLEEGLDGGNLFVAGTYKKILDEIARLGLAKSHLHLQTEVRRIEYRSSNDSDSSVKIQTSDGKQHDFDEVVVTCPLGWLKRNTEAFKPPLPSRLTKAIDSIGYGSLEKLYVSFPSPFWLGKEKDIKSWSCFTNFHSPTYHPFEASRSSVSWNQSTLSLSHLPSGADHPTLLFYMMGDCGAYVTSQIKSHEPHSDGYNSFLKSFAEPFYSLLPNYNSTSSACQPTSFYMTNWQNDAFAGYGSYSTFRTGLTEGDKDIEIMRDACGLSDAGRGLWLAGEHTAPFVALGTTTGAWWSGEGVARRIAKQYGMAVPKDQFSKSYEKDVASTEFTMRQTGDTSVQV